MACIFLIVTIKTFYGGGEADADRLSPLSWKFFEVFIVILAREEKGCNLLLHMVEFFISSVPLIVGILLNYVNFRVLFGVIFAVCILLFSVIFWSCYRITNLMNGNDHTLFAFDRLLLFHAGEMLVDLS